MHHAPAAVVRTTGSKRCLDVGLFLQALCARLGTPVRIVARAAHLQNPAGITDRYGLLLQVSYHAITHFSSRAKKADAFFSKALSSRSCRFSASSCRMRCCSAVSGLPTPGPPAHSASYCAIQRRTAVSPSSIDRQTSLTDNPWSRTIRTTSSLKLASNCRRLLVIYLFPSSIPDCPPIDLSEEIRPPHHSQARRIAAPRGFLPRGLFDACPLGATASHSPADEGRHQTILNKSGRAAIRQSGHSKVQVRHGSGH